MVDLAFKNLFHDKLRLLITLSGIAFAVTLVFVQIGLFLGLLNNATITIEKLGADLWVTSRNTPNVDFATPFNQALSQRARSIPGVERADNLIVWFMMMALPSGARETTAVYALEDFTRWNLPWKVLEGSPADLRRGDYIMMDESSEKRFGAFKVGEYREVLGRRLKIIGRTTEARSFTTTPISFMDYRLAQSLDRQNLRGQTTYTLIKLKPGTDLNQVRTELQRRLPFNDVYTSAEWAKRSRDYWVDSTGIGLNMYLTVFLGCLVGIVVVAQTLYTSTMEHIKEFGTVKAIGGTDGDIYAILSKQASIAALLGFFLGALQTLAVKPLIDKLGLQLIIPPQLGALVFIGTFVLCLGASMISFRKVASIDPALVFRQ